MVDIEKLKAKFFTDPDWAMMEELIRSYIDPMQYVHTIDPTRSNDEIATEVRGRQLAYKGLEDFLVNAGVLKPRIISRQSQFK